MEVVTGIGDDWVLPAWGATPRVNMTWIRSYFARQDAWSALMAENDARIANENAQKLAK